jgi:TPR repeat protein
MKAWQAGNAEASERALELVPELTQLAVDGLADAQYILGVIHKCVTDNEAEAIHLLELASRQGHCEALRLLGYCYQQGEGVEANPTRAAELYRRAADCGDKIAQFNLGLFYAEGLGGLARDVDLAIQWYRKAADQGLVEAFQPLAEALAYRNRDKKDAREAIERLTVAADAGPEDTEYRLESGDGQWSAIIKEKGTVVTLKGITIEELDR